MTVKTKYGITELTIKKGSKLPKRAKLAKKKEGAKASKARKKKEGAEDSIAEDSIIECSGRKRAKRKKVIRMTMTDYRKEFEKVLSQQAASKPETKIWQGSKPERSKPESEQSSQKEKT